MQQKILEFTVDDQFIRAPRYTVVADSRDYLVARFSFSEVWRDLTKTAVFQGADGQAYYMLLENDTCAIPAEVIQPTRFLISVFGGDRLTTDRVMVDVAASGFTTNGIDPPTPTPDVYNQLLESVALDRQMAQAAAVTATEKAEECLYLTTSATGLLESAIDVGQVATEAKEHAFHASASATLASEMSDNATVSAETATAAADTATLASQTAVTAAASAEAAAKEAAQVLATAKNEWQLIADVTFTETTDSYSLSLSDQNYKEVYFEGLIYGADKETPSQQFTIGISSGQTVWSGNGAFDNTTYPKVYARGHIFLSPGGTVICDATISLFGYTLDSQAKSFTSAGRFSESIFTEKTKVAGLFLKVAGGFAEGTAFKVWGR